MEKQEIFQVIKRHILSTLVKVQEDDISMEQSLHELGANSIDRTDIALQAMEDLRIKVSSVELAQVQNLEDLVEVFHGRLAR